VIDKTVLRSTNLSYKKQERRHSFETIADRAGFVNACGRQPQDAGAVKSKKVTITDAAGRQLR
jgi:hypothetical protein